LSIFQSAHEGDSVARDIIEWSARELGESACAVIRQLNRESNEFDVVLTGSIFGSGDIYIDPLRETIHKLAPQAKLIKLEAPPVPGAVILSMQKAGLGTAPRHKNLIESSKAFINDR
jgi:N-acetylglucosamine kinase-like BadF-type ATPase